MHFRYLKSTIGNISLIQKFRKRAEDKEKTPEETIFNFWMDFFMDATKADPGDLIRFPVSLLTIKSDHSWDEVFEKFGGSVTNGLR